MKQGFGGNIAELKNLLIALFLFNKLPRSMQIDCEHRREQVLHLVNLICDSGKCFACGSSICLAILLVLKQETLSKFLRISALLHNHMAFISLRKHCLTSQHFVESTCIARLLLHWSQRLIKSGRYDFFFTLISQSLENHSDQGGRSRLLLKILLLGAFE